VLNSTLSEFQIVNQTLAKSSRKLLLAANFRNNDQVIPNIMEQTLKLIELLGPSKVEVSVMENDSKDKSRPLLKLFEQLLRERNVTTHFDLSEEKSDYTHLNRIELLAGVRNRALAPALLNPARFDHIIFMNDGGFLDYLTP
jgi:alpha-1,3-mannosyltransferase